MGQAQSAQADADAALTDAQAAAAKAREAQAAAGTAAAAAALAKATAEGNQEAVKAAEADLATAQAAAEAARTDAAAAQADADKARDAAAAATAATAQDEELVLVVGVPGDIQTLDPCCTNFIRGHEAQLLVSDPPVIHPIVEQNGALVAVADELVPLYFESWEESPDGLTYTVTVRQGVTFDDGSEVTAETVRFWVDRNLNTPGGGGAWLLKNIAFITEPPEVIDEYTLQFTTNAPSPMVMQQFYMTSSVPVDPKVVEKYATEDDPWAIEHFQSNVENASGPYRIASWLPDQEVVFEKR